MPLGQVRRYGVDKRTVVAFLVVLPIAMLVAFGIGLLGLNEGERRMAIYADIVVCGSIFVVLAVRRRR